MVKLAGRPGVDPCSEAALSRTIWLRSTLATLNCCRQTRDRPSNPSTCASILCAAFDMQLRKPLRGSVELATEIFLEGAAETEQVPKRRPQVVRNGKPEIFELLADHLVLPFVAQEILVQELDLQPVPGMILVGVVSILERLRQLGAAFHE